MSVLATPPETDWISYIRFPTVWMTIKQIAKLLCLNIGEYKLRPTLTETLPECHVLRAYFRSSPVMPRYMITPAMHSYDVRSHTINALPTYSRVCTSD